MGGDAVMRLLIIAMLIPITVFAETATIEVSAMVDNAIVFGLGKDGEPMIDAESDCRYFEEDGTIYKNC